LHSQIISLVKKSLFVLITLIVAFFSYLFLRPSLIVPKGQVIAELQKPCSKFFRWNNIDIHYTDEGSGIPLLMVHGFAGSHRNFQKITDLFDLTTYRIIRVDLPGFGLSDFPEGEEDYLAMYQNFMRDFEAHLQLKNYYLLGNSMGGGISLMAAHNRPENIKGLILCGSAGYDMQQARKNAASLFRYSFMEKLFAKGVPLWINQNTINRVYYNPAVVSENEIKIKNRIWNKEGNLATIFRIAQNDKFPDEKLISAVKVPTLVLWGKQDNIIDVKYATYFDRDIKDCEVVVYDSCGHMPVIEKAERAKLDIERFIERTNH
jgi:pimeloyl-ACP methyl ester carboxylesterase